MFLINTILKDIYAQLPQSNWTIFLSSLINIKHLLLVIVIILKDNLESGKDNLSYHIQAIVAIGNILVVKQR